MANVTFTGHHRNLELAQANLSRLIRKHGATSGEIVARRSSTGKFSARGRNFWFSLQLPPNRIFRLSIGITYPWHHEKYLSFMLQHWQGSTAFSDSRREALTEITIRGLEKELGYDRSKFWFDLESAIGTEHPAEVSFRKGLRGTYELTSEHPDAEVTGTFRSIKALREFVGEGEGDE